MKRKRTQKVYELRWGPTGQRIGTVTASTMRAAIRKAPYPYRKYLGEIGAEEIGPANPGRRRSAKAVKRANASKRSKEKRVAKSLKQYVDAVLGKGKSVGATMKKNPGGTITIIPLKRNAIRRRGRRR